MTNPQVVALLPYYRVKDIVDIEAEWATVKNKGSDAEIQEFKDRRKRRAKEILDHSTSCEAWERADSILKRQKAKEMRRIRQNECAI